MPFQVAWSVERISAFCQQFRSATSGLYFGTVRDLYDDWDCRIFRVLGFKIGGGPVIPMSGLESHLVDS